jgi:hypothetical protein
MDENFIERPLGNPMGISLKAFASVVNAFVESNEDQVSFLNLSKDNPRSC